MAQGACRQRGKHAGPWHVCPMQHTGRRWIPSVDMAVPQTPAKVFDTRNHIQALLAEHGIHMPAAHFPLLDALDWHGPLLQQRAVLEARLQRTSLLQCSAATLAARPALLRTKAGR